MADRKEVLVNKKAKFVTTKTWRGRTAAIVAAVALTLGFIAVAGPAQATSTSSHADVAVAGPVKAYNSNDFRVRTHVQNVGWTLDPGTRGRSLRIEAIEVTQLGSKVICLNAHVAQIGWQNRQCTNGRGSVIAVGTTGRALAIEAVEVTRPNNTYAVGALAHIQNVGDRYTGTSAGVGGFIAGTTGRGLRLEWFELSNS